MASQSDRQQTRRPAARRCGRSQFSIARRCTLHASVLGNGLEPRVTVASSTTDHAEQGNRRNAIALFTRNASESRNQFGSKTLRNRMSLRRYSEVGAFICSSTRPNFVIHQLSRRTSGILTKGYL